MLAFSNSIVVRGSRVMLHGDVTSKASSSAFHRLSIGVNMLCGHSMPWATALIQAETELVHSYSEGRRRYTKPRTRRPSAFSLYQIVVAKSVRHFYELVLRLKDYSYEDVGVKLQDRLCHWLA